MPTRQLIALARRMNARSTPLPQGQLPPLPPDAVELRTRYGSFWFDGADHKVTPWIRRHATWEADVVRLLGSVVLPGATVVDVGANVGFHTVLLSRLVGPTGRVHAFEPLPVTVDLLRANLWRHSCANVALHDVAVSDRRGVVSLQLDPEGRSGAYLAERGVEAAAVTLDEILGAAPVSVLKVDVEGAEPQVLRGATKTVAASRNLTAVVEFRGFEHLDGSTPQQVLDLYEELGFRLCLLAPDGRALPASQADVLAAARRVDTLNIVLRK